MAKKRTKKTSKATRSRSAKRSNTAMMAPAPQSIADVDPSIPADAKALEKAADKKKKCADCKCKKGRMSSCTYFVGMIGAGFYYIQQANGATEIAIGVGKALVWPAFLIYEALKFVGA